MEKRTLNQSLWELKIPVIVNMCLHVYVYTSACVCACRCPHVSTCVCLCTDLHICVSMGLHMHCVSVSVCVPMWLRLWVYMCAAYLCVYMRLCLHMYLHMNFFVGLYVHWCVYECVSMYVPVSTVRTCDFVCIYMCQYLCVYCTCDCVYVGVYTCESPLYVTMCMFMWTYLCLLYAWLVPYCIHTYNTNIAALRQWGSWSISQKADGPCVPASTLPAIWKRPGTPEWGWVPDTCWLFTHLWKTEGGVENQLPLHSISTPSPHPGVLGVCGKGAALSIGCLSSPLFFRRWWPMIP